MEEGDPVHVSCLFSCMVRSAGFHLGSARRGLIHSTIGASESSWASQTSGSGMGEVRRRWGDEELAAEKVRKRRLKWLGHVATIGCQSLCCLVGSLSPAPGVEMVCKDLKDVSIAESKWYEEARRSRAGWRAMYRDGLANHSESRAAWQCVRWWCVRFASGRSGGR